MGPSISRSIMARDTGLVMLLSRPCISLYNAGVMNDGSR